MWLKGTKNVIKSHYKALWKYGHIFEYYSHKSLGPKKRNRYYKKDKDRFYYIYSRIKLIFKI